MTRPTACGPRRMPRAISHQLYSSLTGTTSSWQATWNTESADVYTIGLPVRTCSSPSSSMMPVPDAGRLQRMPRPMAASKGSTISAREALRIGREGPLQDHAHHLPVAGGRVLAGAALEQAAVGRRGARRPERQADDLAQAKRGQIRQGHRHALQHVPQCARALVAVLARVGQLAGAAAVQHAHEDPGHDPSVSSPAASCPASGPA